MVARYSQPSTHVKTVIIPVSDRHEVRARFTRQGGRIIDFAIVLCNVAGGQDDWLVRYETHGGAPHRHVRWDDEGPDRHHRLHSWPNDPAAIIDRAIDDMISGWKEYQTRYDAWIQKPSK